MRHKPFHNPVILDVLRATVFNGPTSMVAKYSEHFVSVLDDHKDEAELPSGLVVFVVMTVSVSYAIMIHTNSITGLLHLGRLVQWIGTA
jgi:hypothetical protein